MKAKNIPDHLYLISTESAVNSVNRDFFLAGGIHPCNRGGGSFVTFNGIARSARE